MTDTLIQKLEEKVMMLVTELEDLRFEVQQLKQENSHFKAEKARYTLSCKDFLCWILWMRQSMHSSRLLGNRLKWKRCYPDEYATI